MLLDLLRFVSSIIFDNYIEKIYYQYFFIVEKAFMQCKNIIGNSLGISL